MKERAGWSQGERKQPWEHRRQESPHISHHMRGLGRAVVLESSWCRTIMGSSVSVTFINISSFLTRYVGALAGTVCLVISCSDLS